LAELDHSLLDAYLKLFPDLHSTHSLENFKPSAAAKTTASYRRHFHADLPSGLRPIYSTSSSYGTLERADKNRVIPVADDDSKSQPEHPDLPKMPANCFAISGLLGPTRLPLLWCSIFKVLALSAVLPWAGQKGVQVQTVIHGPTEAALPPAGAVSKGASLMGARLETPNCLVPRSSAAG